MFTVFWEVSQKHHFPHLEPLDNHYLPIAPNVPYEDEEHGWTGIRCQHYWQHETEHFHYTFELEEEDPWTFLTMSLLMEQGCNGAEGTWLPTACISPSKTFFLHLDSRISCQKWPWAHFRSQSRLLPWDVHYESRSDHTNKLVTPRAKEWPGEACVYGHGWHLYPQVRVSTHKHECPHGTGQSQSEKWEEKRELKYELGVRVLQAAMFGSGTLRNPRKLTF